MTAQRKGAEAPEDTSATRQLTEIDLEGLVEKLEAELAVCQSEVRTLTHELDSTNRGLLALHAELEQAKESEAAALATQRILADRDRIGRELQTRIVRQLFEAGMALQRVMRLVHPDVVVDTMSEVVDQLDATAREIRDTVFPAGELLPYTTDMHA